MKKKQATLIIISLMIISSLSGQDEFKPPGGPFVKIFADYHANSSQETGFEITRAYFGYSYKMSPDLSGNLTLDVGNPEIDINDSTTVNTSFQQTVFLKNAMISHKRGKVSLDFGLIGLKQFNIQEKFWGRRYIRKSFQDEYKLGSSADLGASITYSPMEILSMDYTIMNGEGYKKLQSDKYFKSGVGITLKPIENLTLRGYGDYLNKTEAQVTIASFIGYKIKEASLGFEYNIQNNNKNKAGYDLSGYSIYGAYEINNKFEIFARYDNLTSSTLTDETTPWNNPKNGSDLISGIQYVPIKNVTIAINYQSWNPAESGESTVHGGYLNFQYSF